MPEVTCIPPQLVQLLVFLNLRLRARGNRDKYGLRIFDEERQDRSRWGPIDGTSNHEEPLAQTFKFGSDQGDTPEPDIDISGSESKEREERALAALAQLIPTHITRPHFDSIDGLSSLAARMSQIAATTTLTSTSTLGRTVGAGVPSAAGSGSANLLRNLLGGGGRFGGGPPHGTGPPGGGGPPDNENPPDPAGDPELEEGEIPQTPEEGEILLTADSPIN
jgi:hypothetical protein